MKNLKKQIENNVWYQVNHLIANQTELLLWDQIEIVLGARFTSQLYMQINWQIRVPICRQIQD